MESKSLEKVLEHIENNWLRREIVSVREVVVPEMAQNKEFLKVLRKHLLHRIAETTIDKMVLWIEVFCSIMPGGLFGNHEDRSTFRLPNNKVSDVIQELVDTKSTDAMVFEITALCIPALPARELSSYKDVIDPVLG